MACKVKGELNIEYLVDDRVYAISLNEAVLLIDLYSLRAYWWISG
jgi:hypothetical protein